MEFVAFQAMPPIQREGLPYWIFYLMLCAILLLFLFIFLRDRRLRMRLSSFFAGARRRSLLLRLNFKLKKEGRIKAGLLKKLGEKAWDEDIPVEEQEGIRASLHELFKRKEAGRQEWKAAFAELERLHKRLEESVALHEQKIREQCAQKQPFDDLLKRKREEEKALKKDARAPETDRQVEEVKREQEVVEAKIDEFERQIKEIRDAGNAQRREIEKGIHYWQKRKEKVQEKIKEIEAHQDGLYLSFGRIIEEARVDHPQLSPLYSEMDLVNSRIAHLRHRIETLSGG